LLFFAGKIENANTRHLDIDVDLDLAHAEQDVQIYVAGLHLLIDLSVSFGHYQAEVNVADPLHVRINVRLFPRPHRVILSLMSQAVHIHLHLRLA
jgi:hypothetical protein